jgi:hypothetical protein
MPLARKRILVAAAVGSALGLAVACDFPNPVLVILDPGGPPSEAGPDTPAPANDGSARDADRIQGAFDGSPDAIPIVTDAGHPIDASGCTTCDCDEDLFDRADCDGGTSVPKDCDDNDPRYAPDQGFLAIKPDPGKSADWNCDRTVTPFYTANEVCGGLLQNCAGREGFLGNPGCGEQGSYVFCVPGGLLNLECVIDSSRQQTRTQACQ